MENTVFLILLTVAVVACVLVFIVMGLAAAYQEKDVLNDKENVPPNKEPPPESVAELMERCASRSAEVGKKFFCYGVHPDVPEKTRLALERSNDEEFFLIVSKMFDVLLGALLCGFKDLENEAVLFWGDVYSRADKNFSSGNTPLLNFADLHVSSELFVWLKTSISFFPDIDKEEKIFDIMVFDKEKGLALKKKFCFGEKK